MKKYVSASLGSELDKYQKWVDYDMKRYGRISDKTNEEIDKAGLEIVKDKYGDYEVIASRRSIKASLSGVVKIGSKVVKDDGTELEIRDIEISPFDRKVDFLCEVTFTDGRTATSRVDYDQLMEYIDKYTLID